MELLVVHLPSKTLVKDELFVQRHTQGLSSALGRCVERTMPWCSHVVLEVLDSALAETFQDVGNFALSLFFVLFETKLSDFVCR